MQSMNDIRTGFLDFRAREYEVTPSAPLVPGRTIRTLLFAVIAGMVPSGISHRR
ncbi:MAG: hypothetical protein R3C60_02100 [Parvularculaceae bacterium]